MTNKKFSLAIKKLQMANVACVNSGIYQMSYKL